MAYGPRYWEDYIHGSSDNPVTLGAWGFKYRPDYLEKILQDLSVKFLNPDQSADVQKTNSYRIAAAVRAGPTFTRKRLANYRRTRWEDELIIIDYSSILPERIEALADEEKVPIRFAAEYSGIDEGRIRSLIRERELRGTKMMVNLSDLNKYKK